MLPQHNQGLRSLDSSQKSVRYLVAELRARKVVQTLVRRPVDRRKFIRTWHWPLWLSPKKKLRNTIINLGNGTLVTKLPVRITLKSANRGH